MRSEFEDFQTRDKDARLASERVEKFVRSCTKVIHVRNVEDDEKYQEQDIDLLCTLELEAADRTVAIEIKGDTKAHKTGNFFFETVSNEVSGTQGCFLKSTADLLFYCLLKTDRLYIFPLRKMQNWFLRMRQRLITRSPATYERTFPLKATHTRSPAGGYQHTTIGRCAKIEYTKKHLKAGNICFREIEEMSKWRCTLEDFCLKDI